MTLITIDDLRKIFENYLRETMRYSLAPLPLVESMLYSLLNGGKRVRPSLLLQVLAIQSVDLIKPGLRTALALEAIHTYSLIHDDLPAMDNDDFRRGQPTNHRQFSEATAILAGDALLTDAFGWIANDDLVSPDTRLQLIADLSTAAGSIGMVAGQIADIQAQGQALNLDQLKHIHHQKTGQLFIFAVKAAALIASLPQDETDQLLQFARHFGQAFQIHNDLMDLIGDQAETGKTSQADLVLEKATYPAILGLDGAKAALEAELSGAQAVLDHLTQTSQKNYQALAPFLSYIKLEDAHG